MTCYVREAEVGKWRSLWEWRDLDEKSELREPNCFSGFIYYSERELVGYANNDLLVQFCFKSRHLSVSSEL